MAIIKIIVNELAFETLSSKFQEDDVFLREELEDAVEVYSEKSDDDTCSIDKLKALNWEVVEYTNLLQ